MDIYGYEQLTLSSCLLEALIRRQAILIFNKYLRIAQTFNESDKMGLILSQLYSYLFGNLVNFICVSLYLSSILHAS